MANNSYPLEIKSIRKETTDTISISFEVPAHLRAEFDYEPGQYLTLEVVVNDRKEKRSYSLCSSPLTDHLHTVSIKRVEGGLVSNYLNDNSFVGMVLNVMPPMGYFYPKLNEVNKLHYVIIGGGSGITPLYSIIKSVLDFEKQSKITLLYANSNEDCIIYKEDLANLAATYNQRLNVVHCLSRPSDTWTGEKGRIDAEKLNNLLDKHANDGEMVYYLCGPTGLIECAESTLKARSVDPKSIHKEYFVLPEKEAAAEGTESGEIITQTVKVIYENEEFELVVEPDTTVLDAAIEADIDPPYACKAAACSACRAKVMSGKVKMDDREILSDEEIEEGFVLTCQSHPLTDDVVLSYDE